MSSRLSEDCAQLHAAVDFDIQLMPDLKVARKTQNPSVHAEVMQTVLDHLSTVQICDRQVLDEVRIAVQKYGTKYSKYIDGAFLQQVFKVIDKTKGREPLTKEEFHLMAFEKALFEWLSEFFEWASAELAYEKRLENSLFHIEQKLTLKIVRIYEEPEIPLVMQIFEANLVFLQGTPEVFFQLDGEKIFSKIRRLRNRFPHLSARIDMYSTYVIYKAVLTRSEKGAKKALNYIEQLKKDLQAFQVSWPESIRNIVQNFSSFTDRLKDAFKMHRELSFRQLIYEYVEEELKAIEKYLAEYRVKHCQEAAKYQSAYNRFSRSRCCDFLKQYDFFRSLPSVEQFRSLPSCTHVKELERQIMSRTLLISVQDESWIPPSLHVRPKAQRKAKKKRTLTEQVHRFTLEDMPKQDEESENVVTMPKMIYEMKTQVKPNGVNSYAYARRVARWIDPSCLDFPFNSDPVYLDKFTPDVQRVIQAKHIAGRSIHKILIERGHCFIRPDRETFTLPGEMIWENGLYEKGVFSLSRNRNTKEIFHYYFSPKSPSTFLKELSEHGYVSANEEDIDKSFCEELTNSLPDDSSYVTDMDQLSVTVFDPNFKVSLIVML